MKLKEGFMKIKNVNNIGFRAKYYEGYIKDKSNNAEFFFRIKDKRPELLLNEKQNEISKIIENKIAHTRINGAGLEYALEDKTTDIYFKYPQKDTINISLVKWGIGDYGNVYYYTPLNKNGTKKIETSFNLTKMTMKKSLQDNLKQFISDAKDFLTGTDNGKNKEIERKIEERC